MQQQQHHRAAERLARGKAADVVIQLASTSANIRETTRDHIRPNLATSLYQDRAATASFQATGTVEPSSRPQVNPSGDASTSGADSNSDNISDDSIPPPPNYHEIPGIVPSYHGRASGPPPAYDDVMNLNGSPPSYQSLFGQMREARKNSNGLVDLLRQLFLVLIGTIGCTMIIGFLLLIPITMIFIGILYVNECRAENIPTFLVVGGLVWIIKNILNCYNQFKRESSSANRPPPRRAPAQPSTSTTSAADHLQPSQQQQQRQVAIRQPQMIGLTSDKCESILNYFLIVWFLAGCIVVYRIYEPDYENPLSANYCHRTIYLYAFWLMTSAIMIIVIVLSCLGGLLASSFISCER